MVYENDTKAGTWTPNQVQPSYQMPELSTFAILIINQIRKYV